MNEWVWSKGGVILSGEMEVLGEKHVFTWLYLLPHIPQGVAWDQTRVTSLGGQSVTLEPWYSPIRSLCIWWSELYLHFNNIPYSADQIPSPKTKTWKGRVARQFRRIQQGSGSPSSPTAPHPEGVTIGVPLEDCPQVWKVELQNKLHVLHTSI